MKTQKKREVLVIKFVLVFWHLVFDFGGLKCLKND